MTDEEYLATQQQIIAFAGVVRDMPLAEFIERIVRAESAGPIVDPTLYRQAAGSLDQIKGLAVALAKFQQAARAA